MKIDIELTQDEVREALVKYVREQSGLEDLKDDEVVIKVRSRQNYRDKEWETGEIQVSLKRSL